MQTYSNTKSIAKKQKQKNNWDNFQQQPVCWGGLHQSPSMLNKQAKHGTLTTLEFSDGA